MAAHARSARQPEQWAVPTHATSTDDPNVESNHQQQTP